MSIKKGLKITCIVLSGLWCTPFIMYCLFSTADRDIYVDSLLGLVACALGVGLIWGIYFTGFWIANRFKKDEKEQDGSEMKFSGLLLICFYILCCVSVSMSYGKDYGILGYIFGLPMGIIGAWLITMLVSTILGFIYVMFTNRSEDTQDAGSENDEKKES